MTGSWGMAVLSNDVSITKEILMGDSKSKCEGVRNYFSTKPVLRSDRIPELFSFFVEPVSKAFDDNSLFFASVGLNIGRILVPFLLIVSASGYHRSEAATCLRGTCRCLEVM